MYLGSEWHLIAQNLLGFVKYMENLSEIVKFNENDKFDHNCKDFDQKASV